MLGIGTWAHFWTPDSLRQIFEADSEHLDPKQGSALIAPIFGDRSIFLTDGPRHLRLRRIVLPTLRGEPLREHYAVMQQITERAVREWPLNTPFSLRPRMQAITMRVILRTVFGIDEGTRLERLEGMMSLRDRFHASDDTSAIRRRGHASPGRLPLFDRVK